MKIKSWILSILFFCLSTDAFSNQGALFIKIIDAQAKPGDTMYLQIWDDFIGDVYTKLPTRLVKSNFCNGMFILQADGIKSYARIGIGKEVHIKGVKFFIPGFLAEAGDSIEIITGKIVPFHVGKSLDSSMTYRALPNLTVQGKGAAKYTCQYEILQKKLKVTDSIDTEIGLTVLPSWRDSAKFVSYCLQSSLHIISSFNNAGRIRNAEIGIFKRYGSLTSKTRDIIEADMMGDEGCALFEFYQSRCRFLELLDKLQSDRLKDSLKNNLKVVYFECSKNLALPTKNKDAFQYSGYYLRFLVNNAIAMNDFDYDKALIDLNKYYNGVSRDKLISLFFGLGNFERLKKPEVVISTTRKNISFGVYGEFVNSVFDAQALGKPAFNFSLPDRDDRLIRLSDFRGKVVFVDFWYTGCGGCSGYFKSVVRPVEEYFKDSNNVVFVTINIDLDKNKWKRSLDQRIYTSELAINLNTDGRGDSDEAVKAYSVLRYPRPILIDKTGKIYSNRTDEIEQPPAGDMQGNFLINIIKQALRK